MHFTIKPVSAACNLNCDYCFYLPKEDYLPHGRMSLETLESFIRTYIAASPSDHVFFTWQGGEPLLAPLDFYRKAFELQKKYANGKTIENAIQTNATRIDEQWCALFKENKVLLGISIDGPEHLHDVYRKDKHGHGTFKAVMSGIELVKKHGIPFNTLTCINRSNYQHPLEVYHFLKDLGSTFMQFSEVVETTPENYDFDHITGQYTAKEFSLPGDAYGDFMGPIFKEWVAHDIGTIVVRQFESIIARSLGMSHLSCVFEDRCPDNFVLEANGDIYECDQAVYPKYKLGQLTSQAINFVQLSEPAAKLTDTGVSRADSNHADSTHTATSNVATTNAATFAANTLNPIEGLKSLSAQRLSHHKAHLSIECQTCKFLEWCHGGCVKHRINLNGGVPQSYFCAGYKKFFTTIMPYINTMVYLENNKVPYTQVKTLVPQIEAAL